MIRRNPFLTIMTFFGFVFLYAPIFSLIIYSFNKSKLVTVWGGFSLKWYGELFSNQQIGEAALNSLKIAFISASIATILGTLAAYVLVRFGRFKLRNILLGMATAPLVIPEVILGISMLMLFKTMEQFIGWPAGTNVTTIVLAHITFCMAYVTVVVQSRLSDMDQSVEEAAADLGAGPVRVFFDITLPIISPALIAGWLLAFTLSLDDLVIASFVSGPNSSTLPKVIFSKVKLGVSPDINALSTLMILVVLIAVIIVTMLTRKKTKT